MTCRHELGDPRCSSSKEQMASMERQLTEAKTRLGTTDTPDSEKYEVIDIHREGPHLVLKILYPNCKKCSYEGNKVLVFLNVSEKDVLRWRKIDPHFRDATKPCLATEAPGPSARFPASPEGWADALHYAKVKRCVADSTLTSPYCPNIGIE